jgi:hypothetical protein
MPDSWADLRVVGSGLSPSRPRIVEYHRGLAGPAWRHDLASGPLSRLATPDDALIRDLTRYIALCGAGRADEAQRRYSDVAAAAAIQADDALAIKLKVMALADMAVDEMAQNTGIETRVITLWERLYFEVRDLRHAHAWLVMHVLNAEREAGNYETAAAMKLAIMGGARAVRAWLAEAKGVPLDEADRLFGRATKLAVKDDVAFGMPIESERERTQYVQFRLKMTNEAKRLAHHRDKLAQRCAAAERRHELVMARLRVRQEQARAAQLVHVGPARKSPPDSPDSARGQSITRTA